MTFQITNKAGIPFNIRIVEKGMRYGLKDCLLCKGNEPLVEFYDARYRFWEYGQFVSRYYLHTLLEDKSILQRGLCLYGGEPEWNIDDKTISVIMIYLEMYANYYEWEIKGEPNG